MSKTFDAALRAAFDAGHQAGRTLSLDDFETWRASYFPMPTAETPEGKSEAEVETIIGCSVYGGGVEISPVGVFRHEDPRPPGGAGGSMSAAVERIRESHRGRRLRSW